MEIVLQVLMLAAVWVVPIFPVCRDLIEAPSDQTSRNVLAAAVSEWRFAGKMDSSALLVELIS